MINALRSEWIKLTTVTSTWILVGIAAAFPLLIVVLTAALAEPFNRDHRRPATTAAAEGDGYRLEGVKTAVPAATIADAIVVTASIDGRAAAFASALLWRARGGPR